MSVRHISDREAQPATSRNAALLAVFFAAIFLSAGLLFAVEPMFTKMVLPRLGGAASVWTVALVFFQATLLAGYAYAHLIIRFVPGAASVVAHLTVSILACFALPLHIAAGWVRPPEAAEATWLLELFAVSIGLPFFALAANGPLLQAWFSRTDHPAARDPYFLYAASNAGSFLALVAYPTIIEPNATLGDQTTFWTFGYYGLLLLIGAAGFLLVRMPAGPIAAAAADSASSAPTWRDAGRWVALAAVPSGLLLAVTSHIATDVASVPLFWVVPLALYLLTFVIVFQPRPLIPHAFVLKIFPIAIVFVIASLVIVPIESILTVMVIHLTAFFVIALMCHGELARRRPNPRYLTAFYMWISVGGAIGGVATGLIAPEIFNWVAEYPLLIVLSVLCLPGLALPSSRKHWLAFIGISAVAVLAVAMLKVFGAQISDTALIVSGSVLLGLTAFFWKMPLPFAAITAFLLFASHYYLVDRAHSHVVRNFFGVLNAGETWDGRFRMLWHGSIAQGAQRIRDNAGRPLTGRPELISEFVDGGSFAQVIDAVHARIGAPIDFAVIGLGTGALTCRASPGDNLTYYEINAAIIDIARDPTLFNFVSECGPNTQIRRGDARLTLEDAADASYDLIVVDAFISAAIPVHLLTREAMALYLRKLKPHGVVALHVANKYLELPSVVAGVAESNGVVARVYDGADFRDNPDEMRFASRMAVVARSDQDFGVLADSKYWPPQRRDPGQRVWTDDYSNIIGAIRRNLGERTGDTAK